MNQNIPDIIGNNLSIDNKEKFLKISKKLQKNLNSLLVEKDIFNKVLSLSQIQELFSKSLGFRDFNELEKILEAKKENEKVFYGKKENNLEKFLKEISPDMLNMIIVKLMDFQDMWRMRALEALKVISTLFYQNILNEDKFKNTDIYKSLFIIENLVEIYKKSEFFENKTMNININGKNVFFHIDNDTRNLIFRYLSILPGFDFNNIEKSEMAYQNHGFVVMPIIKGINDIKIIENDVCIYKKDWGNKEEFTNNLVYSEIIKELYEKISNSRNSQSYKYISNKDSIYVSDIYYYYGTLKNLDEKQKINEILSFIEKNQKRIREISMFI